MALTKLTSNLIEGGTGTDWVTAIQTSNFTAAAGKGYFVNTTSQVLYVNLPVGVVGMEITIQDYAGTFATNKVILNANGSEKIQGSALEGRINTNNATAVLIYQDATKGWTSQDVRLNVTEISWATPTGQSLTYSTPSPQSSEGTAATTFPTTTFTATKSGEVISGTATIAGLPSGITAAQTIAGSGAGNILTVTLTGTFPSADYINTALTLSGLTLEVPLTVDYLVVAGAGGSGSRNSGGGGAGGVLENFTSTSIDASVGTSYTVTVGGGGAAGAGGGNYSGSNGTNSVFDSYTAIGGGASNLRGSNGASGGSGGGASEDNVSSYVGGSGTPGPPIQGYDGGGTPLGGPCSAGGGGAGGLGGNGTSTSCGVGGLGIDLSAYLSSYGDSGYFSSGGGGGTDDSSISGGSASSGGGKRGRSTSEGANLVGFSGDPNTGGGAGGGAGSGSAGSHVAGGAGGSGVVILRYPNSFTISGLSGTTTTLGSDKITTFTAGTGNIQFN